MRVSFCLASLYLVALIATVYGASRPTESVPNCDAASPEWGCPPDDYRVFRNGRIDRLTCNTRPEPRMSWATKVVRSNAYSTWAGAEDAKETEYVPEKVMDISIRVNNYAFKYRGILIYAQDADGNRVGEWLLPDEQNPFFQLPWPNTHECRQSITHQSAELKPLKSTWKWKAPPKGTGPVTFHCLIKQGDANTGAFYWPNNAGTGPLQLTESSARKPRQTWFQSNRGQSCTDRCAEENLLCDVVHMERVNSPTRIEQLIIPQSFPCKLPYVSGCSNKGATMGTDGLCYFDDTRCADQGRNTGRVTCDSRSGDTRIGLRMCKCLASTLPPANPGNTVIAARGATSPATKSTTSFLFMALAVLGLTMRSSGKMTTSVVLALFLIALVSFPSVNAHNWATSFARSTNIASTTTPCPPRRHASPHVQLGAGQQFEIEWAVGHTQPSYYVIVKAEDEARLKEVSFAAMNAYMDNAPAGACQNLPVYHRQFRARTGYDAFLQYYSGPIAATSPNFIPRPEAFGGWADDATLFGYKDELEVRNYCEYASNDLDFVLGIFKFEHYAHRPQDADMVRLTMPAGAAFGDYVVQWLWRGYRDCVDVNYVNKQVEHIYGLADPVGGFTRIDHCYLPARRDVYDCHRIYTDTDVCARACSIRRGCNAYIVMPRQQLANQYNAQADLLPQLCKDNVVDLGEDPSNVDVCFGVRGRIPSETFGLEEVVHAGDPAYHSTCYIKGSGRLFADYIVPPQHQDIPWRHGDECISCDAVNLNKNITRVPKWPMTNDCRNCDLEPKTDTPPFDPPKLILREADHYCDGHGVYVNLGGGRRHHDCPGDTWRQCKKEVLIRGRASPWHNRHFAGDCAAAASRDPECSDEIYTQNLASVQYQGKNAVRCYCMTKMACCNGCRPRAPGVRAFLWNVYTLDRGTS